MRPDQTQSTHTPSPALADRPDRPARCADGYAIPPLPSLASPDLYATTSSGAVTMEDVLVANRPTSPPKPQLSSKASAFSIEALMASSTKSDTVRVKTEEDTDTIIAPLGKCDVFSLPGATPPPQVSLFTRPGQL